MKHAMIALVFAAATAQAGVKEGGGGKAVQCGNELVTLDLYEAKRNGLTLIDSKNGLEADLRTFGPKMIDYLSIHEPASIDRKYMEDGWFYRLNEMVRKSKDIPSGETLPDTQDVTTPKLEAGCQLVQVLVYDDETDLIMRDPVLWNRLDSLNQAALLVHEYVYWRARQSGASNSDEVRNVVGRLFSKEGVEPIFKPIWNKRVLTCLSIPAEHDRYHERESQLFYLVDEMREGQGGVSIHFSKIKDRYVTSRTDAYVPNVSLEGLAGNSGLSLGFVATSQVLAKSWSAEVHFKPMDRGYLPIEIRVLGDLGLPDPETSSGYCILNSK